MFTLLIVFTFPIFWNFILYDWYSISWKTGIFDNVLENVFASKHLILEWFPEPGVEEVYKEMIHFCSFLWINYRTKVIVIMLYNNKHCENKNILLLYPCCNTEYKILLKKGRSQIFFTSQVPGFYRPGTKYENNLEFFVHLLKRKTIYIKTCFVL